MAREAKAGRLNRDEIEERTRATRKGRGVAKGKAKKVTTRVFKTAGGPRVTVEFKKGLDGSSLVAALREALAPRRGPVGHRRAGRRLSRSNPIRPVSSPGCRAGPPGDVDVPGRAVGQWMYRRVMLTCGPSRHAKEDDTRSE